MKNVDITKIDNNTELSSDKVENGSKPHKPHTFLLPEVTQTTRDEEIKKKKRKTTIARQNVFLTIWEQTLGSVKATCEKANVPRRTYYDWMRDDSEFAEAVRGYHKEMLEDLDQMGKLQCLKGDSAMIRFYLERLHPLFNRKIQFEGVPATGEKTLEEEFDELEFVNDNDIDLEDEKIIEPGEKNEGENKRAGLVRTPAVSFRQNNN